VGINVTVLRYICGVPKLAIFLIIKLLSAFFMPKQELGLLSCCELSSQPRNDAKIPCHPHRSPSVSLLLAFDLAGLVLVITIIIISTILFPLVPIIATHGALVRVCIISTEQHRTVLACMDFFNLYSQRTDYLLRLIDRLFYLVSFR
jgi:hypothetical protein